MVQAPQRQAQVLGSVEVSLFLQKRCPYSVVGGHVMPFGQWPHQPLPKGAGGLLKDLQFGGFVRGDGKRQVALRKAGCHTKGPPLPTGLLGVLHEFADCACSNAAAGLHRRLAVGGDADGEGRGVEFDAPQRVFKDSARKGQRGDEECAEQ